MASDNQMKQLQDLSDAIMNIDEDKLLRSSLGEASLKEDFAHNKRTVQT